MAFCTGCGSGIAGKQFCMSCGKKTEVTDLVPIGSSIGQYYVRYATGQIAGPLNDDMVNGLIARHEVLVTDSIKMGDSQVWVPIYNDGYRKEHGCLNDTLTPGQNQNHKPETRRKRRIKI